MKSAARTGRETGTERSIDDIISEHDIEYKALRRRLRRLNFERGIKSGSSKREDWRGYKRNEYNHGDLPDFEFYKKHIVPVAENVCLKGNAEDFERHSRLLLDAIEVMTNDPQKSSYLCSAFLTIYRDLLHDKSERTVMNLARMQSRSVWPNRHDVDALDRYSLKNFFDSMKEAGFNEYLDDMVELANTNLWHCQLAQDFLRKNAVDILKEFRQRNLEHAIKKYLEIAPLWKNNYNSNDLLKGEKPDEIADELEALESLGPNSGLAYELYRASLEKGYYTFAKACQKGFFEPAGIKEVFDSILNSQLSDELEEAVKVSIGLCKIGIDGVTYLREYMNIRKHFKNRTAIHLQYLVELARLSKQCANNFIRHSEDISGLNAKDQLNMMNLGLKLAKEFGDKAEEFYWWAPYVLKNHHEKFDYWIDRVVKYAEKNLENMGLFMTAATHLLKDRLLDTLLDAGLIFLKDYKEFINSDDPVAKWLRQREQFSSSGPFYNFFTHLPSAARQGIKIYEFTEGFSRFFRRDQVDGFTCCIDAVKDGIDYHKFVDMLPELMQYGLERRHGLVRKILDSDAHPFKKSEFLRDYALASTAIHDILPFDFEGKWEEDAKTKLEARIKERLHLSTEGLSFSELIKLGSIDYWHGEDTPVLRKLNYIIGMRRKNEPIKKNFQLGKKYGEVIAGGVKEKQDPVRLTEYLVYGLISRKPELREEAENYFERGKLEEVRRFISPVDIFNLIETQLDDLKRGSMDAAKTILSILRKRYPRKELLGDLVTSVESVFQDDIRFDALEFRMQESNFNDLFDSKRFICCAFYPQTHHGLNYLLHKDIGLLHMVPREGSKRYDPIGVAICVNALEFPGIETKYLIVDSVEGGAAVDRIRDSIWIPAVHDALMACARDQGAQKLIYNITSTNIKPIKVVNYLRKNGGRDEEVILCLQSDLSGLAEFCAGDMKKYNGLMEKLMNQSNNTEDEDDDTMPDSFMITSEMDNLKRGIEAQCHLYLEGVEPLRQLSLHNIRGWSREYDLDLIVKGRVAGIVFDVNYAK